MPRVAREPRPDGQRVVVTGLGVCTALGTQVEPLWQALCAGKSGIGRIRQFASDSFPVSIGGEIELETVPVPEGPSPEAFVASNRTHRFAHWAAWQAVRDAGLERERPRARRSAVCIGAGVFPSLEDRLSGQAGLSASLSELSAAVGRAYRERPELFAQLDPAHVAASLAQRFGFAGPVLNVQAACASGSQAIGLATELVRDGEADVVLTGGADSMMSALCIVGFDRLGALSKNPNPERASCPFDARRDGFVMAEGAAALVIESLGHARARGATIYAELAGYGSASDAYRFTDLHPQGEGACLTMRAALQDAGLAPEDVDYVNAHGTSTVLNDAIETAALRTVFGAHADALAVSSTKSQLGHLICAAGAIECLLTVLALRDQRIPPTINLQQRDPSCDLDYVSAGARDARVDVALSNSFGFGGQNATLVLRRFDATEPREQSERAP